MNVEELRRVDCAVNHLALISPETSQCRTCRLSFSGGCRILPVGAVRASEVAWLPPNSCIQSSAIGPTVPHVDDGLLRSRLVTGDR